MQKIFKKYIDNLTKADKFIIPEYGAESVSFEIGAEYKHYTYFVVRAYSNGQINTHCNGNRKTQNTTYLIDEQLAKNLIQEVKDRYDEINDIIEQSRQTAIEGHNIDKFFEAAEALSSKSFVYRNVTEEQNSTIVDTKNHEIKDVDGSLTAELKDVGYRYMPDHKSRRKDNCLDYKINDDWYFQLFNTQYYIATVTYKYENPFFETEVQMAYDINDRSKVNTFVAKIQEMISNQ